MARKKRKRKVRPSDQAEYSGDDVAYAAFAALWALALASNYLQVFTMRSHRLQDYVMAATIVAAIWLLLNPASIPRLLLLSIAAVILIPLEMPQINNHELVILVLSATQLAAFALVKWSRGLETSITRSEFYQAFKGPACWIVIVVYFWATVHKLNTGYFDKDLSCATMQLFNMHQHTVFGWPLEFVPTGDFARYFAIYGTLIVETAIPVLLAIPRTRVAGVVLGAGFHFILGFSYPAFSAFIYSQLVMFLPSSFWSATMRWWSNSLVNRAVRRVASWRVLRIVLQIVFACVLLYALFSNFENMTPARSRLQMRYAFWLVYGFLVLILFARLLPLAWKVPATRTPCFRLPHPSLMIAPVLLFLNGLAPHVGFKATQSFAMYSNLRTEDGMSNHLLFPAGGQLFEYEKDLVTIEWSTDPMLHDLSQSSWRGHRWTRLLGTYVLRPDQLQDRYPKPPTWKLPYVSLKQRIRYLADHGVKDITVVYVRDGEKHTVTQAENNPELTDIAYWETKLFRLRAVPDIEDGCCMW